VDVPVYASRALDVGKEWPVDVIYQGCSQEGLCYPPQTIKTQLKLLAVAPVNLVKNEAVEITSSTSITPKTDTNNANSLAEFLQGSSFGLIIGTFLVLGIGLSFTPCVLPMIPILSGIIAGQGTRACLAKRGFLLSLSYVVGMATTYALGRDGGSAILVQVLI
jgi:thiol:disulfide interchange protein DsbD